MARLPLPLLQRIRYTSPIKPISCSLGPETHVRSQVDHYYRTVRNKRKKQLDRELPLFMQVFIKHSAIWLQPFCLSLSSLIQGQSLLPLYCCGQGRVIPLTQCHACCHAPHPVNPHNQACEPIATVSLSQRKKERKSARDRTEANLCSRSCAGWQRAASFHALVVARGCRVPSQKWPPVMAAARAPP